eukprot:CAMPEP_0202455048 /NCGR_PEP_ID=MMETSP1360-20130828/12664_1 /ASSEMBLY_ACC=CAM_ASM_000848 /TAXON_ID=515479 /ORGANISM="Licmophora paradoxa, Strain CCMP2313" /LENGTH=559 /DNA_ID=CAMNT_0049074533 /DNA_START=49 /DNA_END=1725 /DNA_ORIENTATION=+
MTEQSATFIDTWKENVKKGPNEVFLTQPMGEGKIKTWTRSEVQNEAMKMAGYISTLDLPPKSQIAICSKNCSYWIIADLAIWYAGHVSVPVFPTLTAETTAYTLEHSESKLLFVGKLDQKPWEEQKQGIPKELPTISFPLSPPDSAKTTWADIMKDATPIAEPVPRSMDEMATIIYTSGSTGKPKGVMTSFSAMTVTSHGIIDLLKVTQNDRYLSYLPISHGMERWLGEVMPMVSCEQIFYADSLATFVQDLNRCQPTLFLSVPRLWYKFQAGVFAKLPEKKLKTLFKIPIVSSLVKKKIIKSLGLSKARFAGSGSAPLSKEVLEWYRRLGLELLEGYGMTENFNYSHLSNPGKTRAGYVGQPYQNVEQRIADDGEIQVKTPGKMMGYFKNEEATKETLTEDGFVRTGDKGEIDSLGRLKITGRTKEIFKTSKGKYVAPAPIEGAWAGHNLIELAVVSGRAKPQPYAILQLSEQPKKDAISGGQTQQKTMTAELEKHLKTVNATLEGHERLQFVVVMKEEWLPENGFLTPTQKIKRSKIEDTYDEKVDGWYDENKKVIW